MTDEPTTPGPDGTPGDPAPAAPLPPIDPNQAAATVPPPTGNRAGIVAIIVLVLIGLFLLLGWLLWWSDDDDTEDTLGTGSIVEGVTLPDAPTIPDASIVDGSTLPTIEVTLPPETTAPPTTAPVTTAPPTTAPATTAPPTTTIPEIEVPEGATLREIIDANADGALSEFAALVEVAEQPGGFLPDALDQEPLTIFAPSNEAIQAARDAGADLTDPPVVASLIFAHSTPNSYDSAAVLGLDEIMTIGGDPLLVDADAQTINGANFVSVDHEGSNGFLHVVDAMLVGG